MAEPGDADRSPGVKPCHALQRLDDPTTSCPGTRPGITSGRSRSTTWRSVRRTPQARTRTRTSPGPGSAPAAPPVQPAWNRADRHRPHDASHAAASRRSPCHPVPPSQSHPLRRRRLRVPSPPFTGSGATWRSGDAAVTNPSTHRFDSVVASEVAMRPQSQPDRGSPHGRRSGGCVPASPRAISGLSRPAMVGAGKGCLPWPAMRGRSCDLSRLDRAVARRPRGSRDPRPPSPPPAPVNP